VSTRRWLPLVLAVAGLIAVAALASHGHPLSHERGSGPTPVFFDYVLTTAVIVGVGIVLLFLFGLSQARARARTRTKTRWTLLQALVMFAVSALIAIAVLHAHFHQAKATSRPGQAAKPPDAAAQDQAPVRVRSAHIRWDEVAIVAALLAAAGVAAFATRKTRPPKAWIFGSHEEVALALDESLDDLRNEPDLRRAIIAAYARMERTLAVAGIPRQPWEAPLEYMSRALRQLDASADAVTRLTHLFEWAKFSQHEPDESMRDEAIAALVAVRDELRKPVEVAA
jgi:Domain of unknown function (DUF4129)